MHRRPRLSRPTCPTRRSRIVARLAPAVLAAAGLAACTSGGSDVRAAPSATAPACATALGAAPATVLDQARTASDVAGTVAYGSPPIVVRCGLPPLRPTSKQCISVDDVDWVLTSDPDAAVLTFAAFGRTPTVEVRVPVSYGPENAASGALVDLGPVARALPSNGRACVG